MKRTEYRAWLLLLLLGLACGSCRSSAKDEEITVFAAASLTDAIGAIGDDFSARRDAPPIAYNFAGSNTLARQLLASPKADLFISANSYWMDQVSQSGALIQGSRSALLGNTLVVVAHRESNFVAKRPSDIAKLPAKHLAIGDPTAVPAGIYAKRWLQRHRLWSGLRPRVLPMRDVRAALATVRQRRDAIAIVYRSDVMNEQSVRVLYKVDPAETNIRYEVAQVADRPASAQAQALLAFLRSEPARQHFRSHGFEPLN